MIRKTALVSMVLVVLLLAPLMMWLGGVLGPAPHVLTGAPKTANSFKALARPLTETLDTAQSAAPVTATLSTTVSLPLTMNGYDPANTHPFGIAMYGAIDAANGVTKMQAAGAERVTTILQWSVIEPTQGGGYNWSAYDAKLANASAAGLRIHVLFDDNPAWTGASSRGPVPPAFMLSLENVVSATVQHYNGTNGLPRVDSWSFYGEPDNEFAWGLQGAAYADMLAQVTPIVHNADYSAKVVLGGLAYDCFIDVADPCSARRWVQRFLPDTLRQLNTHPGKAAAYIDAVAFNFYPISLQRWPTIREKAQTIRSVMNQYGVGQLPLIVPEMSMWSMWPNLETQPQQAHWLVEFYVRGLSVGIQQMYWFQVFDLQPVSPGSAQGLFRGTNLADPKQSYYAYGILAHELRGLHFGQALNIPGAEGYVFTLGALQKTVIWGTQPSSATPVNFPQTCARRVVMLGGASQIADGGPGDLDGVHNGSIQLSLNFDEPIYVETC